MSAHRESTTESPADRPASRAPAQRNEGGLGDRVRRLRLGPVEALYMGSLATIAVAAFAASTPRGSRWVPPDWAWTPALFVLLGIVTALVAIARLAWRARRHSQSVLPRLALVLPVMASLATCQLAPLPSFTVEVGGRARGYRVYRPTDHDGTHPRPLVLVLHGFMQDWKSMRKLTDFDRLAEREDALVVYPEGYRRSWNDGDDSKPATAAGVDDAAYLRAVIDDITRRENVDERRVYAVGFSNSGFLLVRHACRLADRVAAIGVIGAGVYPIWDPACEGPRPMPAMFILGEQDPMLQGLKRFEIEPSRSGELWAAHNGCTDSRIESLPDTVDDGTRVRRKVFSDCADGAEVVAVHVEGGGHTWPGGPQYLPAALVGPTSRDINATDELWSFFASIRLPARPAP